LSDESGASALQLSKRFGLSRTVATWLARRGMADSAATSDFLDPRLSGLTLPDAMADRDAAASRIAAAVRSGERIVVFGDYDCDGITATAILTEAIRALGGRADPLLASRFAGGYGVSPHASDQIAALSPGLLVTCDCGSSDHERLASLRDAGIDAVVIDHHLVPDDPLPATAFLNPHRPECGFPYKGMASCGLALSVVAALRKQLGAKLDVRRWLDLVAIGTIADVAPLDGDNRILVRSGLSALARGDRPGVRALLELLGISMAGPVTSREVSFRIAPQLNAPGRMGDPDLALRLLLAADAGEAQLLAAELSELTQRRREQQDAMLAEARQLVETEGYVDAPAIVVGKRGWNHGIVGIVAGRLADDFARPVAVVGFDSAGSAESATGRGSIRGPEGCRLFDALSASAEHLLRFGGHQAAAGFEVEFGKLGQFRRAFCDAIAKQGAEPAAATESPTIEWFDEDAPNRLLADLDRLEPCSADNPRPLLQVRAEVLSAREVGTGHLKARLRFGGWQVDAFGPNQAEAGVGLTGLQRLVGDLRRNTFRGVTQPELFIERFLPPD
jgi:single-stranded-DNA-specific exonuclease